MLRQRWCQSPISNCIWAGLELRIVDVCRWCRWRFDEICVCACFLVLYPCVFPWFLLGVYQLYHSHCMCVGGDVLRAFWSAWLRRTFNKRWSNHNNTGVVYPWLAIPVEVWPFPKKAVHFEASADIQLRKVSDVWSKWSQRYMVSSHKVGSWKIFKHLGFLGKSRGIFVADFDACQPKSARTETIASLCTSIESLKRSCLNQTIPEIRYNMRMSEDVTAFQHPGFQDVPQEVV